MKVFADANFVTNMLLKLPFTAEVDRLLLEHELNGSPPILVTRLVRQEVINALHRLVFESRASAQGISVSLDSVKMAEVVFISQLDAGRTFRAVTVDEAQVDELFFNLVHRHTAKHGFRTNDVLHVASALVLECDTFWSFDKKAKRLAELEGLRVN